MQAKVEPVLHQCVGHITALAIAAIESLVKRNDAHGLKIVAGWTAGFLCANFEALNVDSGATLLYSADVLLKEASATQARDRAHQASTVFSRLDQSHTDNVVGRALAQLRLGLACHLALLRVPDFIPYLQNELNIGASTAAKDVVPSSILIHCERTFDQFLLRLALDDQEREHSGHTRLSSATAITNVEKRRAEKELSEAEREKQRLERLEALLDSEKALGAVRDAVKFEFDKAKARQIVTDLLVPELRARLRAFQTEQDHARAATRRLYESPADFQSRLTWMYRKSAAFLYSQGARTLDRLSSEVFKGERHFVTEAFKGLKARDPEPPGGDFPWFKVDPRKFASV